MLVGLTERNFKRELKKYRPLEELNEEFLCNTFLVPNELVKFFKFSTELKYEIEAVRTLCEYYHKFYKGSIFKSTTKTY